jgi:hydrogenase maturation protease
MKGQGDTLVLGLGNPLRRDDGVGPRVVAELARCGLPRGVTVLDGGTGGLGLLSLIEGWRRVVIVDAADISRAPGDFVRFLPDDVHLAGAAAGVGGCRARPASLHNLGLAEVLALARSLGHSLPELVVYGVQPADVGWGEGLSQAVEAGIPRLTEAVLEETTGECHAEDPSD